jgi:hypothetical protein
MIIDRLNEFSDAQAVTVSAASTNVVDMGSIKKIEAKPFYLVIKVPTAVTASGAATVTFALQTDSADTFDSAATPWTSSAIGKDSLTQGTEVIRLALNGLALEQYLRVYYTVANGPLLTGAFDAFLTFDGDTNEF